MSKVKKNKRKATLNYLEVIFVKLKSFSLAKTTSEEDKQKAKSLVKWFRINGYLLQLNNLWPIN